VDSVEFIVEIDQDPEVQEPDAREAVANLRAIRELMERSTKHSTFSGLSGVLAGLASVTGCWLTRQLELQSVTRQHFNIDFTCIWFMVIVAAIGCDYLLTKRKAALVGKRIVSRLGKQMVAAAGPGLGTGALLTLNFLQHGLIQDIYPMWMLCYGCAVSSVGLFSQREVLYLGASFLFVGAGTLAVAPHYGLWMMAVAFGGLHILYGCWSSRRDGWL
jgi:hypothetical protein